jgi:hypothetical protein
VCLAGVGIPYVCCFFEHLLLCRRGPTTGEPRTRGTVTLRQNCQIGLIGLKIISRWPVLDFSPTYCRRLPRFYHDFWLLKLITFKFALRSNMAFIVFHVTTKRDFIVNPSSACFSWHNHTEFSSKMEPCQMIMFVSALRGVQYIRYALRRTIV